MSHIEVTYHIDIDIKYIFAGTHQHAEHKLGHHGEDGVAGAGFAFEVGLARARTRVRTVKDS
jgi:hypothetical protein